MTTSLEKIALRPGILKTTKSGQFRRCRPQRSVSISDSITEHSVHSRDDMRSFMGEVFYSQNDYDFFMFEARAEVFAAMHAYRISQREAKTLLFQPHQPPLEKRRGRGSWIQSQAVLFVSLLTYFAFTIVVKYSSPV